MSDYGRVICNWCRREVGCYTPAGGDGSGMRVRKHAERKSTPGVQASPRCPGSKAIVTDWDER